MSIYEVIVIIFLSMTFAVGLIRLIVYIVDVFSKRK